MIMSKKKPKEEKKKFKMYRKWIFFWGEVVELVIVRLVCLSLKGFIK